MYSHGALWMAANFLLMSFIRFRRSLLLLLLFCICSVRKKTKRNVFSFCICFFFVQALQTVNRFLAVLSFFLLFCLSKQKLKLNWKWKHAWGGGRVNSVTNLFNNRKPNKSNQMHSPHTHTHTHTSSRDTQLTHTRTQTRYQAGADLSNDLLLLINCWTKRKHFCVCLRLFVLAIVVFVMIVVILVVVVAVLVLNWHVNEM